MRPLVVVLLAVFPLAAQTDLGQMLPEGGTIRLTAFGDFGDLKHSPQTVADAMYRRHQQQPFALGVTLGDNFYPRGVKSVDDPKWTRIWEDLYARFGIVFYAALGNHDYKGNEQAQIDYAARSRSWEMPARYYTYAAGPARFLALDTTEWDDAQRAWLDRELASKPAPWRIVYGHHPVFTYGRHRRGKQVARMERELLPLLARHGVRLYLSGHDHDFQHLREAGIDFFICGGGGTKLRKARSGPRTVFAASQHGFCEVEAGPEALDVRIFNTASGLLHATRIPHR
ncbi:MAG: metallophosphoesterase [Bryobacterales bacterium]|nr:metallophosphoesterase [Bryobacterales bacterium]